MGKLALDSALLPFLVKSLPALNWIKPIPPQFIGLHPNTYQSFTELIGRRFRVAGSLPNASSSLTLSLSVSQAHHP